MITHGANPALGDSCIPFAKINAVLELLKTDGLKPKEDLVIDNNVAVGIWFTLLESTQEIKSIIEHCEKQEYAEVKVRREARKTLDERVSDIRAGRL